MADKERFQEELRSLVAKFERDKNHYFQKGYPEAQLRVDFLDPLFEALGWDIQNKSQKPPHDRDVQNQLPIRTIDFNNPSEKAVHDKLVSVVERMLDLHKKKATLPPSAEREKIERETAVIDEKIDGIVYGVYGITEEEKRIIEMNLNSA